MGDGSRSVEWTAPQRDAINSRGGPLLVSAAAGSGKTAVLSQRVIDIITDPNGSTGIDRFLIVTFTNLAAEEMKQRINKKLSELLRNDPFNEKLLHQQLLLSKANISTIDSFCGSLVREYFYALDIPSDFRIADEQEREILRNAAIESVFERRYDSGSEEFLALIDVMSGSHDDTRLKEIVLRLFDFLSAQPFPEEWIKKTLKNYDGSLPLTETIWGKTLVKQVCESAQSIAAMAKEAERIAAAEPGLDKLYTLVSYEAQAFEALCETLRNGTWDEARQAVEEIAFGRFPTVKKIGGAALSIEQTGVQTKVKELRDKYKDSFKKRLEPYLKFSEAEFSREIQLVRPVSETILRLEREFSEEYRKLKLERGAADYSDLEHLALSLLAKSENGQVVFTELAAEIAGRFDYVMVDEYQDVNMLQETIFNAVSGNDKTLFAVGDVKQSIYGFRQAMPEIFIARKSISSPYDSELQNYPAKVILDANFRSRKCVTDSVNCVFGRLMSHEVGGIDYTDEEALVPRADYPHEGEAPAEFHLIGTDSKSEDNAAAEARYIGGLINNIVGHENVYDNGQMRPAEFGDICIIMRSINSRNSDMSPGLIYAKELMKQHIPVMINESDSFFAQAEIRLVLSFLRVIENPARDIPLAAILMSPIFGFTADDIARLRSSSRKGLYELILGISDTDERAAYFCTMFDKLRLCSGSMTSYRLISRIYEETLLPEIVLSDSDGEYRQKNLLLLLDYAKAFESSGYKGMSGFVQFIDKLSSGGSDLKAAGRSDASADNSVKIMTVHKSKGLEYPICIAAGLGKAFNTMFTRENVVFHSKMGVGTYVFEEGAAYKYKGLTRSAVELEMKNDMISEELRLLYVAMTRAKERLILTAAAEDCEKAVAAAAKKFEPLGSRAAPYSVRNGRSFCEELLFCLFMSRDGAELRMIGGLDDSVIDENDSCRWKIVICDAEDNDSPTIIAADEDGNEEVLLQDEVIDGAGEAEIEKCFVEIEERLSRRYKYAKECSIPMKAAASAVAEKESGVIYSADAHPAFLDSEGLSSAQKGTAMHEFVQRCDFIAARNSIDDEKRRLVKAGYLTERQADAINNEKAETFLRSELAQEICSSKHAEREYRFIVEVPAGLTDATLQPPHSETKIILQGAIDCLYEIDEGIVIVDYKTDRAKDPGELSEKYSAQLRLYKYAAEKIFEKPVVRCVLWSFSLGCTIEV